MPKTSHKFKKGERVFISSTETFATVQDITPNKDGKILVQMYILPSQMSALKNFGYRFSDENNFEGLANASFVSENGEESKTRLAASTKDEPSDLPDLSAPVKDNSAEDEEEEFQAQDESEEEEDINTQVGKMLENETDMLSVSFSSEDVPQLDHSLRKKDKINYEESDEDYQSDTDDDDLVEYTPSKTPERKKYKRKNKESTGRRKRGKKNSKFPKSRKRGRKNTRSSDSYDTSESIQQQRPNYAESDEDYQSETDEDDIVYLKHVRRKQIRAKVKEEESRGRKKRSKTSVDDDYDSGDDF